MRLIICSKYQQELEGFEKPPFPGPKGQLVFDTLSKKAWSEWLQVQTRLINEKQLNPLNPASQQYLDQQFQNFIRNETFEDAEGYVPEKK